MITCYSRNRKLIHLPNIDIKEKKIFSELNLYSNLFLYKLIYNKVEKIKSIRLFPKCIFISSHVLRLWPSVSDLSWKTQDKPTVSYFLVYMKLKRKFWGVIHSISIINYINLKRAFNQYLNFESFRALIVF